MTSASVELGQEAVGRPRLKKTFILGPQRSLVLPITSLTRLSLLSLSLLSVSLLSPLPAEVKASHIKSSKGRKRILEKRAVKKASRDTAAAHAEGEAGEAISSV